MSESSTLKPLYVDLDGTLIKSDVTFEAILLLLRKNVVYLALMPFWLMRGRPYFKKQLTQRVTVSPKHQPFNKEFLQYLKDEKARGRELVLISASEQHQVEEIGRPLELFSHIEGTNGPVNLKGANKLARIQELAGERDFGYAGNSLADLAVWAGASELILVNCPLSMISKLAEDAPEPRHFDKPRHPLRDLVRASRPHQWLKNLLLFLPLILSHRIDEPALLALSLVGFVSFCLCASSVYLFNDMLDLQSDREHPLKRHRPFASGELPLTLGFIAMPLLLLASFAVAALFLPLPFLLILVGYWLLTTAYSLVLKRLFLVDVLVLASLYTLRIMAGSAAISVETTDWLLTFSMSLFLGLAILKRVTELTRFQSEDEVSFPGRAYHIKHRRLLIVLGVLASVTAVGVFALYINAPQTTRLYSSPEYLWLICPLLLFLLGRVWRKARSGSIEEDPVLFAITDHISQAVVLLSGVVIWLAI